MNEIKLKKFTDDIFNTIIRESAKQTSDDYDNNFWANIQQNSGLPNYDLVKEDLKGLILAKTKEEFLQYCSNIVKSRILPYFSKDKDKVLIWTNYGIAKYDYTTKRTKKLSSVEQNYSEYTICRDSPVFSFLWYFVEVVLTNYRNNSLLSKLGMSNTEYNNSYLITLCREQYKLKMQQLSETINIIANEIYFNFTLGLLKRKGVKPNPKEVDTRYLRKTQELVKILKSRDFAEELFNKFLESKNAIFEYDSNHRVISYNLAIFEKLIINAINSKITLSSIKPGTNQFEIEYYCILSCILQDNIIFLFESENFKVLSEIFRIFANPFPSLPYDKVLSELFMDSIPENKLEYTRIEFGQNTDNSVGRMRYGENSVAHINPENVLANSELPILLLRVAQYNIKLERYRKTGVGPLSPTSYFDSEKIESQDNKRLELSKVCPKITLENTVLIKGNTKLGYLVFSRPELGREVEIVENDTVRITLRELLEEFEDKTWQFNAGNTDLKQLPIEIAKTIIKDKIKEKFKTKDSEKNLRNIRQI